MKRKRNLLEETCTPNNASNKKNRSVTDKYSNVNNHLNGTTEEEKKEEFILTKEIADNAIISDTLGRKWRLGPPIGKGSFGEIFLASNNTSSSVDFHNADCVTKIEPHSNGPLFVEIHCLLNVTKKRSEEEEKYKPGIDSSDVIGIPKYIASGSHYFGSSRYRFLIMPRYKTDLHSIMRNGKLSEKHFLIVASQIIDILRHLHSKYYVHSDIKAENIMIGLSKKTTESVPQNAGRSKQLSNQFVTKPLRNCRFKESNQTSLHQISTSNVIQSHYLRPNRSVSYTIDENSRSTQTPSDPESDDFDEDEDFELSPRKRKANRKTCRGIKKSKGKKYVGSSSTKPVRDFVQDYPVVGTSHAEDTDDKVFVIDYGLASKFIDTNGEHKPFCMDQRRAHDGTLEFTSRDAHFGAHARRSDLECLGYNLIYWSQGFLPWKNEKLKDQPEIVHRMKEVFMTDVQKIMKLLYGKNVPGYLGEFMRYVGQLEFDAEPDYGFLKGLFEKEFLKLGFEKSEMKLNLSEMRKECKSNVRMMTENDLMITSIVDIKSVQKLGFLIAIDSTDETDHLASNVSISVNVSCKSSPKNLRSKEKVTGKRNKRQSKASDKELISEKMAQGKKLSIAEIAVLDPDQIAKDRADREYEKYDEKVYYQTPQRYKGNPTYAILEIESKLNTKQVASAVVPIVEEIDPMKGNVIKKQQFNEEQELMTPRRSLKRTKKQRLENLLQNNLSKTNNSMVDKNRKKAMTRKTTKVCSKFSQEIESPCFQKPKEVHQSYRKKCGRAKKSRTTSSILETETPPKHEKEIQERQLCNDRKRKRGRPKMVKNIVEPIEVEEDSVYYDIPGEGSNDSIKDISEDDSDPKLMDHKSESVESESLKTKQERYYADDDYDASSDESTNISSGTVATESLKTRQSNSHDRYYRTRNKVKSRSTSRSAGAATSDQSELSDDKDSEYQIPSEEDSCEEIEEQPILDYDRSETDDDLESDSELADDSNDSEDSIDIKYSPIKTRHARRRVNNYNIKQVRGRRLHMMNENARNFRLVATQG